MSLNIYFFYSFRIYSNRSRFTLPMSESAGQKWRSLGLVSSFGKMYCRRHNENNSSQVVWETSIRKWEQRNIEMKNIWWPKQLFEQFQKSATPAEFSVSHYKQLGTDFSVGLDSFVGGPLEVSCYSRKIIRSNVSAWEVFQLMTFFPLLFQ